MGDEKKQEQGMDYMPEMMGNIWTDRLFSEFQNMKGYEISEEEYQQWKKKEGL